MDGLGAIMRGFSHPLGISFCQIIIDRDDIYPFALQRIQISRKCIPAQADAGNGVDEDQGLPVHEIFAAQVVKAFQRLAEGQPLDLVSCGFCVICEKYVHRAG